MSIRLDDDQTEKLKLYRALTGRTANNLITGLVREFFECQGDAEIAEALTERAKRRAR
jgi:predicted DNA-binding protein